MGGYEEGPQCLELPFMTFIPCVGFGCGGLGFHVYRDLRSDLRVLLA